MIHEFRIFGPPGSGKTNYISRQVEAALRKYQPEEVVACSFTRAAALELVSRDVGLPRSNVGTIHSLCFHRLGEPPIVEVDKTLLAEWNERYPMWLIEGEASLDEVPHGKADELLAWNRRRSCLERGPYSEPFALAWEAFKSDNGAMDFTDLLLHAPETLGHQVRVLFLDEAQDCTPLQWRVVRRWGEHVETFVVAGDDDQLAYSFLGAIPEAFLTSLPEDRIRILGRSYRLPRSVYNYAERWVSKLAGRRQEKHYEPRQEPGGVINSEMRLDQPKPLVEHVLEQLSNRGDTMILASCGYMLLPLIAELRRRGVPYHNPYRPARGDWNPLRTTGARLLAFLRCARALARDRIPPAGDWWAWAEMLDARKTLRRGAKKELKALAQDGRVPAEGELASWLTGPVVGALEREDLDWLEGNLTGRFQKAIGYPMAVLRESGEDALTRPPRIIVGTIHSVKGGEASAVYVFPDLSYEAWQETQTGGRAALDSLVRLAYVGMTRTKNELWLGSPSREYRFHWNW